MVGASGRTGGRVVASIVSLDMLRTFSLSLAVLVVVGCTDRPSGTATVDETTTFATFSTSDATSEALTDAAPTSGAPTTEDPTSDTSNLTSDSSSDPTNDTGGSMPPVVTCSDLPPGFVGADYQGSLSTMGGTPPYDYDVSGLPPGLATGPGDDDSLIVFGVPTQAGSFPVHVQVVDSTETNDQTDCEIEILNPPLIDGDALLDAFPDGCVPFGVAVDELVTAGILPGGAWTCALDPGRGNGSGDFDADANTPDSFPPGLVLDEATCTMSGPISPTLPFGTYAWILTFSQGGADVHVPYCAPQPVQTPAAYSVQREDTGDDATLKPGLQQLGPGEPVAFGSDVPDPKVTIADGPCQSPNNSCFYAFVFAYNTLSGDATVSANPNAKFPNDGFEGFTHAIRMTDANQDLLDRFAGRPFVVNMTLEYCIADNNLDCGNSETDPALRRELIRQNGGGTNYMFSLVLVPG